MVYRYFYQYGGHLAYHDDTNARRLRQWIMQNAREHVTPVSVVGIDPPVGTILRPAELRRMFRTARRRKMVV